MWGMILLGFSLSNWVYVCARARVLFIFRWLYIKKTLIQMLHASMIMNDKTSWHVFLLAWMIHKWIIWNFISFILRIKLWSWGFILMLVVFIIIFMIMLKKKCVSNPMHLDQTSLSHTHTQKKKEFWHLFKFFTSLLIIMSFWYIYICISFFFFKKIFIILHVYILSFYNLFIKLIEFNKKSFYRLIFQNPFKKLRLV
jgi:hypothetical protein